jgi:RNA polymerase subunit RPABC4/transcription elongation factor Spt4
VEDLARALMDRTDVFHFSGHGEFAKRPGPEVDKLVGQGVIILATEDNRPEPFPAAELAKMLASKGVRLAVLGACEGAQTGYRARSHIWGGVAASLLREGIPAVLAMQYVVNDRLAAAFMGAFYRALVAGYLVDEAVALGRAAIRREARLRMNRPHMRDWGVPVLYNRAPDGRVFHPVSDEEGRIQAEEELEDLVRQEFGTLTESSVTVGAIDSQSATVEQKVHEESRGILIGGVFREESESMKRIVQEIAVASGLTIGSYTGDPGHLRRITDVLSSVRLDSSPGAAPGEVQAATGPTASPPGGEEPPQPSPTSSRGSTCPNCGRPVEENWGICPYCRADLRSEPTCPTCGKPVKRDWAVCPYCRTSLH